jgi:hypothetical protein
VLVNNNHPLPRFLNAHPIARWPVLAIYWLTKYFGRRRWFEYLDHSKHRFSKSRFRRCSIAAGSAQTQCEPGGTFGETPRYLGTAPS